MSGKPLYREPKKKLTITLTATALDWPKEQQKETQARSLSDTLERLARGIT